MPPQELPTIKNLRALIAVCDTGTETKAAKELGVEQSSIARHLRAFRGECALLTEKGVELTPKGHMILPSIRELLRQYDQLNDCIAAKCDLPAVIVVATGSSASQHYLPAAVVRVLKERPGLEVDVRSTRGSERIAGVADGQFDLAIVSHDKLQIRLSQSGDRRKRAELQVEEFTRQPLCVVASNSSPQAEELSKLLAGHEVPPKMLLNWPLIGLDRSSGIRRQIERIFANHSEQLRYRLNASGWLAVKEYARHGLGVAILPLGILTREDEASLVIRLLPDELCVKHSMVHRKDAMNRYIESMKDALLAAAKESEKRLRRVWSR